MAKPFKGTGRVGGPRKVRSSPSGSLSAKLRTAGERNMPMGMPFGSGVQGKIAGPKYGKGNY
jgi:hypothetical protein